MTDINKQIEEEWRVVELFDDYLVSNTGSIMSLKGGKKRILKQYGNGFGYLNIRLFNVYGGKYFKVHRLVASAFIPNPKNMPIVNHKDEIKSNNVYTNLEWCDYIYNNNYGSRNDRVSDSCKNIRLNRKDLSKEVEMLSIDGTVLMSFPSMSEASRISGITRSEIFSVCNGRKEHIFDTRWRYKKYNVILKE